MSSAHPTVSCSARRLTEALRTAFSATPNVDPSPRSDLNRTSSLSTLVAPGKTSSETTGKEKDDSDDATLSDLPLLPHASHAHGSQWRFGADLDPNQPRAAERTASSPSARRASPPHAKPRRSDEHAKSQPSPAFGQPLDPHRPNASTNATAKAQTKEQAARTLALNAGQMRWA